MNTSRQKLPVTPEMIEEYYLLYIKSHLNYGYVSFFWTDMQTKYDMFRVTIHMHILDVAAENVDSNTDRIMAFLNATQPYGSDLRELCVKAKADSNIALIEKISIALNAYITFWNENPEVFKNV